MDPWQFLLIHLYKDGRKWLSTLSHNDWRKAFARQPGPRDDTSLQIIQDEGDVNSWIRSPKLLDVEPCKGFVIAPSKHAEGSLTLLAPFPIAMGPNPSLSLQVGILLKMEGDYKFFGYRFESPDTYEEKNEHNFYHAQPIQSFGRHKNTDFSIGWYPNKYPSFPLQATCGLELVAALLLSYWGRSQLQELATSQKVGQKLSGPLQAFLDRIDSA